MKHIVTSRDHIQFVVESDPRSVIADQAFALQRTATELESNTDFFRVRSLDDVFGPLVVEAPRPPTPTERRAAFRLIQGGRS